MIAQLVGTVESVAGDVVVIDVNGVGYEVNCSRNAVAALGVGETVTVIIHTEVREDALTLYGFEDHLEKRVFLLLKTVKGVGAKSASEVLSSVDKHELLRAIGASDVTRLQAVKGIGKKTAERIIVELRDKVGDYAKSGKRSLAASVEQSQVSPVDEAAEALCALGFSKKQAQDAVSKVVPQLTGSEDSGHIVKQALQYV